MDNLVFLQTHKLKNIRDEMVFAEVMACTDRAWAWFCDVHVTHGNADSEDEAEHMASAHEMYFDLGENEDYEGCDLIVTRIDRPRYV